MCLLLILNQRSWVWNLSPVERQCNDRAKTKQTVSIQFQGARHFTNISLPGGSKRTVHRADSQFSQNLSILSWNFQLLIQKAVALPFDSLKGKHFLKIRTFENSSPINDFLILAPHDKSLVYWHCRWREQLKCKGTAKSKGFYIISRGKTPHNHAFSANPSTRQTEYVEIKLSKEEGPK